MSWTACVFVPQLHRRWEWDAVLVSHRGENSRSPHDDRDFGKAYVGIAYKLDLVARLARSSQDRPAQRR